MPSTKELRRRIKSVGSTGQITKAMEMVATAKMRKASSATLNAREYSLALEAAASHALSQNMTHPLYASNNSDKTLVIVFASDRGLAGAFNTYLVKEIQKLVTQNSHLEIISYGKKITTSIARLKLPIIQSYTHTKNPITPATIAPISQFAQAEFLKGNYGKVVIIHNFFQSLVQFEPRTVQVLPLFPEQLEVPSEILFEPDAMTVLNSLLPRLIQVKVYQGLLESLAAEHSARRLAMKSASDNAKDVLEDLTLTFNGVRQGAITQEIAEITSGAAALTH